MAPSLTAERPIDRALSLLIGGEVTPALREGVLLLESEKPTAIAAYLVGAALVGVGQKETALLAFQVGARLAVQASNLPMAVACGTEVRGLGADPSAIFGTIAQAFSRDAIASGSGHPMPPVLPNSEVDSELPVESLDPEQLGARAVKRLGQIQAQIGKESLPTAVFSQPFFSSLDTEGLRELVAILDVVVLPARAAVVTQGDLGTEAFIIARGEVEVEKRASTLGGEPVKLAQLGAGALIGEMALLARAPRAATVITRGPSVLLVATKDALDRAVERAPGIGEQFAEYCKRRMIDNLVRTSAVFRAASPAERPALVQRFTIRTFETGEPLAIQDEPGSGLHLIASGSVSIQHLDGEDRVLLASLGPGEVVGEVALILRRPAIAHAIATTPTVTLFLPEDEFLALVRELPKVFADLYTLAVQRDRETQGISQQEAAETDDCVLV